MVYNYGTAGFRFNSQEIINISQKIAFGCVEILTQKSKHNNFLAIMITASHNLECDNGVKIVDHDGNMLDTDDEKILENIVNSDTTQLEQDLHTNNLNCKILFGRDTRKSGKDIMNELQEGFKKTSNATFIDAGEVSTPLLHFLAFNNGNLDYAQEYLDNIDNIQLKFQPFVDCAGGVGARVLQNLGHKDLKVGNFPENTILNVDCGSEHILQTNTPPVKWKIENGEYGCSLDGDADRLVFWHKNKNGEFHVFDGDNQLVLWALFLKRQFQDVAVISTPYCNGATMEFLKSKGINIILTPTGIKNLANKAKEHSVAVYFENNGHGTAHWTNDIFLSNGKKLIKNELIGDGIYNIFTTLQILEEMDYTFDDWWELYKKSKVCQFKVPLDAIPDLEVKGVLCNVISPKWLKERIEEKVKKYGGRVFMRKSGTEPIIRVYVESNNIQKLTKSIKKKIIS